MGMVNYSAMGVVIQQCNGNGQLICILIISTAMQSESKKPKDILKVKFKGSERAKTKIISFKDLSYCQFAVKLTTSFDIQSHKNYQLYYFDQHNEQILINTQDDFQIAITVDSPVFYFDETADSDFDFRRLLEKELQSALALASQREGHSRVMAQMEQKHHQTLQQLKQVRSILQRREYQLAKTGQKLSNLSNVGSNSSKMDYQKLIEQKRQSMLDELKKFQKKLEEKTTQEMRLSIQKIKKQISAEILVPGDFQHADGCRKPGSKCDSQKRITGLRYRCIVCCIDLCKSCSVTQFQAKEYKHLAEHPMIQFRNDEWDKQLVVKLKDTARKYEKVEPEPKRNAKIQPVVQEKISQLAVLLAKSQDQVTDLVLKYPKYSIDRLLDQAYNSL